MTTSFKIIAGKAHSSPLICLGLIIPGLIFPGLNCPGAIFFKVRP
jgi:hypothetical protein